MSASGCRNCGGDSASGRTSSGNHTEPESCIRSLSKRVAALEAKQAPVLPFIPWSKAGEFAAPNPPAEKAEARTCACPCVGYGWPHRWDCPLNPAPTPCAPAEDAVRESPHGCAVSHDEADDAIDQIFECGSASDKGAAARAALERYICERAEADKAAAEVLLAAGKEVEIQLAEAEQLRAEVARLRAAGSAGQSEAVRAGIVRWLLAGAAQYRNGDDTTERDDVFADAYAGAAYSIERHLDEEVDAAPADAVKNICDRPDNGGVPMSRRFAAPDETKGGE